MLCRAHNSLGIESLGSCGLGFWEPKSSTLGGYSYQSQCMFILLYPVFLSANTKASWPGSEKAWVETSLAEHSGQ